MMNSSRKIWRKMFCLAVKPGGIPWECDLQANEKGDLLKWGANTGF